MKNKIVIGSFENKRQVNDLVRKLKMKGFPEEDVSILTKDMDKVSTYFGAVYAASINDDVSSGVTGGMAMTGLSGIVVGMGADSNSISSGSSPLSPWLGYQTGASVGKRLADLGLDKTAVRLHEQDINQDKTLVCMEVGEENVNQIVDIMRKLGTTRVEVY